MICAAVLALVGCSVSEADRPIQVVITGASANDFYGGVAAQCSVAGRIENNGKNRLEQLVFAAGGVRFEAGRAEANTIVGPMDFKTTRDADAVARPCSEIARGLIAGVAKAAVFGCTMPNVAEGDCQEMVRVSTTMTEADVAAIAAIEQRELAAERARVAQQVQPLRDAVASLPSGGDAALADAIIRADAGFWAVNQYDVGSAHDVTETSRSADGAQRRLHALYTYNGGSPGWVNITVTRDLSLVPCVEFWDDSGTCRPVRIPKSIPVAAAAAADTAVTTDVTAVPAGAGDPGTADSPARGAAPSAD